MKTYIRMASRGHFQTKMSEEIFDFVCTSCAQDHKTVEAVKYCVQCCGYYCQSCTDTHKKFPTLKGHSLTNCLQTFTTEFPTEGCSKHRNKVVDMYCEYHNVVGCSACFVKDHKSCKDSHIHSVPDMIENLFKLSDCKQTHTVLKDMMISKETHIKSKDAKLQALREAKREALDKVTTSQKALEAMLRTTAESSKNVVEAVHKDLKKEILEERHDVDRIRQNVHMAADDKQKQPEGYRYEENIRNTDYEKNIIKRLPNKTDKHISFLPKSLMDYDKDLQGTGQVQKAEKRVIQKHDHLYKIKGSKDINLKLSDDREDCHPIACCLIHDNQLLVTDYNNKKLKRVDLLKMSVVDYCTLDSKPLGVCCISKHEVAVACVDDKKIQFVSIDNKMTPTKQIEMTHRCYDIAFYDGKLHVTDLNNSMNVFNMTGTLLKTITCDKAGNKLFNHSRHVTFNEMGTRMFVGGGFNGLVCFDGTGTYLSTVTDTGLRYVDGVCVDGRGNLFIVGYKSYNVVQYSEAGEKRGVIVNNGDGLKHPRSVCFHQELNTMFVIMERREVVKMYELK